MARPLRLHLPGGFYHVTLRGNHRQAIFRTPEDRDLLASIVADVTDRLEARVHAYCWMTNHIHVLLRVSDVPLGKVILRIASQYARRFQERVETTGHLFERRYHALLVDAEQYLLTLVRYIHCNPVRAGLVTDPVSYPWSSHRDYLGLARTPWISTATALGMLSKDPVQARRIYARWMGTDEPLRWGEGLLAPNPDDGQVLGNAKFINQARARVMQPGIGGSWDGLVSECAQRFQLRAETLASPSRSRRISVARAWLSHEAVGRGIASISSVARRLGRSESAVRRLMLRRRVTKDE